MSFLDEMNEIGDDIPTGIVEPGVIWWFHGVKQAKTPGVFYSKATEFVTPPAAPWESDDRYDEDAYSAAELRIAIIGYRSQWYLSEEEDDRAKKIWLPDYREGLEGQKKQTEYLCFVAGIDDPMVLSVSGKHKAGPIADILRTYRYGILKQASRAAKRQLPLWAFWLPIANARVASGTPAYQEATNGEGKSFGSVVTPPALYLPEKPIDSLYVGNALLRYGYEVEAQFKEWFTAKRGNHTEAQYTEDRPRLAAPASVPQLNAPAVEGVVVDEYDGDEPPF